MTYLDLHARGLELSTGYKTRHYQDLVEPSEFYELLKDLMPSAFLHLYTLHLSGSLLSFLLHDMLQLKTLNLREVSIEVLSLVRHAGFRYRKE